MKKLMIVTGGSRGIGLATAKKFCEESYGLINLSRSPIPIDSASHIQVDFSDPNWVLYLGDKIRKASEGYDKIVLVHNAGLLEKGDTATVSESSLRASLEVNIVAPMLLNQLIIPLMPPGSAIIYVGSTLSEKAVPNSAAYVTSKHATIGIMRSTCQDLADQHIHTACVCPGFTETEMLLSHIGTDERAIESIASGVTQNRLIKPEEIAEAIYFCAENPVVNGSVFHTNLGQRES